MSTWSSYKIELIGNGDQAGTWGTTTNTNLGTAIEQAIGGYKAITISTTTTTLAYTDTNGDQQFRALFLDCSGSPGAASTLVVPAIQKMYIVKNSIGYNLTVKIGSSTGTVVPNGQSMLLYATGTDVISPQSYFSAVTTTTLSASGATTLSGNLTVGSTTVTSGTYGRSLTTVTVTSASHGFSNGQVLYLVFSAGTGGTATSGVYTIANVTTNTFEVTDTATGSITGGPSVSITKYNNTSVFNTPVSYFGSYGTTGQVLVSQGTGAPPQWISLSSVTSNWSIGGNLTVTGTSTFTGASTFNGDTTVGSTTVTSGTYGRSTTTVTVTSNAHGFSNGQVLYLVFSAGTGGTATDGVYTISNVTTNTFDITDTASGTITGSPAVSITKYNNTATLQAPLSSFGSTGTSGLILTSQGNAAPPQWSAAPVTSVNAKTGAIQSVLTQYASVTASALTINTTSGSPTITVTAGTAQVGQILSSTNLPAGTYITAFVSGSNWTVSANASATATGTAASIVGYAFTSVPSWVKRITVVFQGLSSTSTSEMEVQLGTSSGFVSSGYIGGGSRQSASGTAGQTWTSGFLIYSNAAAQAISGHMVLTPVGSNTWVASCAWGSSVSSFSGISGGSIALGAALDRIQIKTTSTDTFDAGSVSIIYE